jgi:hypothetical protein
MKSSDWPFTPRTPIDAHGFAWIPYTGRLLALHWSPVDVKAPHDCCARKTARHAPG